MAAIDAFGRLSGNDDDEVLIWTNTSPNAAYVFVQAGAGDNAQRLDVDAYVTPDGPNAAGDDGESVGHQKMLCDGNSSTSATRSAHMLVPGGGSLWANNGGSGNGRPFFGVAVISFLQGQ